jgi:hypothetical protein
MSPFKHFSNIKFLFLFLGHIPISKFVPIRFDGLSRTLIVTCIHELDAFILKGKLTTHTQGASNSGPNFATFTLMNLVLTLTLLHSPQHI